MQSFILINNNPAGTLFWKWGMCPENTGMSNLEVSAGDSDFINVIAPAAISAITVSDAQSPIANCQFVSSPQTSLSNLEIA